MPRERITAEAAACVVGVPVRTIQALACRGEIPGAAKIGRRWTFDEARLRVWLKGKEDEARQSAADRCRVAFTGAAERSTAASRSRATSTDLACTQMMPAAVGSGHGRLDR